MLNWIFNIFKLIYEEGEKEWLDETKYKEALQELYYQLEVNDITEEEYENAESEILDQLAEVRKYKKEHGYS
jgi:hypothetical protein